MVVVFIGFSGNSQELNSYKYVIVPDGYDFLKRKKDQYQLNSLSIFLFKKYGFNALLESEPFPEDLQNNHCNALYADVENVSSMFTIKLQVSLKDCKNNVVFSALPGKSRSKEFQKGYQEALRATFMSVKKINYFYKESPKVLNVDEVVSVPVDEESMAVAVPISVRSVVDKMVSSSDDNKIYVYKGVKYGFKKRENGFRLVRYNTDGSKLSIGDVFSTSRPNNYLVKASELSGNGYFDSFDNFVLERINPATGKVITDTFAREDQ